MVINSFASLRKGDLPTIRWTYGYISPPRYFQFYVFTVTAMQPHSGVAAEHTTQPVGYVAPAT